MLNLAICFFLIIIFFHLRYGLGIINPTETAWLMKYDWAQHYMGWYFFRNEPWSLPLGNIHNLFYPIGTNVGFTDSIPLIAILLKPLSPILSEQFQYLGFWLFLGHVLVAFFSIKLFNRLGIRGWIQLVAVVLITFNPMLMYRAMHVALSSHWLVIANLWIYFLDPHTTKRKNILLYQFLILLIGGLINPYFALINGGFLFILTIKLWLQDRIINFKVSVAYLIGSLVALVGSWIITGYFALSSSSHLGISNAYGLPSWNLSSFFNPYTFDRFSDFYTHNLSSYLPANPLAQPEQYESFSYLGLGLLILTTIIFGLMALHSRIRNEVFQMIKRMDIILLGVFTLLLALFATSNIITFNEKIIFSFPLPSFLRLFSDIFRASARFIWVAYYLWIFFAVYILTKASNKQYILIALSVVVIIQFADIRQMIFNKKLEYAPYKTQLAHESYWEELIQSTDEVLFLPPLQSTYQMPDDWRSFSFLAAKNRKPISAGHIARIDFSASQNYAQRMLDQISQMNLDSTAMYVMLPGYYAKFLSNYFNKKADIITLDGYLIILPFNNKYKNLPGILAKIKKNVNQSFVAEHFVAQSPLSLNSKASQGNSDLVHSGIYEIAECVNSYVIRGWAFAGNGQNSESDSVNIMFQDSFKNTFYIHATKFDTGDVVEFFNNPNLSSVGFLGTIDLTRLPAGIYQIGVEINYKDSLSTLQSEIKWMDNYLKKIAIANPIKINKPELTANIKFDINVLKIEKDYIIVEGWAFPDTQLPEKQTYLVLSNSNTQLAFKTSYVGRSDVASFFNNPRLENSGFSVKLNKKDLDIDLYNVGILIEGKDNKYILSDKILDLRIPKPPAQPEILQGFPDENEKMNGYIDIVSDEKNFYRIAGWSLIDGIDNKESNIFLLLESPNHLLKVPCKKNFRPDLKSSFNNAVNIDSSGFEVELRKEYFRPDEYKLFLLIENGNSRYSMHTDKQIKF
jgi:hypothetical protein